MPSSYRVFAILYSIILLGFVAFVSLLSLGIKENAKPTPALIALIVLVLLTVALLSVYPILRKRQSSVQKLIGAFTLSLILSTLGFGLYTLWQLDLTVVLAVIMAVYLLNGCLLIGIIGRQMLSK